MPSPHGFHGGKIPIEIVKELMEVSIDYRVDIEIINVFADKLSETVCMA
jgi:hypothetical protein